MAFPLPHETFQNCNGLIYCMAKWVNTVTYDAFWTLMLLGMCFILYMTTAKLGPQRAFGFASITGLFGSLLLLTLSLMTWWVTSIFILVGAVGITILIISSER